MSAPSERADVCHVDVSGLAPGQTRAVEAEGIKLLVCNVDGAFFVIENRCPHAMVTLDQGTLRGCVLECPVHGGTLDVRDGSPQSHPIRRSAQTFSVREVGTTLEVSLS
ncbi:MAG: Rieske 2Fe-2S domain-containing protein [Myxococcota bacterium]